MRRTTHISVLPVLALSIGSALAAGCAVAAEDADAIASPEAPAAASGRPHLMLTEQARVALPEAKVGQRGLFRFGRGLSYYGGPIIQKVNVIPVYWNTNSPASLQPTDLDPFYSAVVTGPFISFLSQCHTASPAQPIVNGTRGDNYSDDAAAVTLTDADVQAELTRLLSTSALPAASNNNVYMVHFPLGVTITSGSDQSCVTFCAYHSTYVLNGQDVYYGVIPDLGNSGCAGGCGGNTVLNNTTTVVSHELAEAITDPAVGLANFLAPPLAWYNLFRGEIGDLCNGQQTTATLGDSKSYTVQKLWSNSANTCAVP